MSEQVTSGVRKMRIVLPPWQQATKCLEAWDENHKLEDLQAAIEEVQKVIPRGIVNNEGAQRVRQRAAVIDRAMKAIPSDAIELARSFIASVHMLSPGRGMIPSSPGRNKPWVSYHNTWVTTTIDARRNYLSLTFPTLFLEHMKSCAFGCKGLQVFQGLVDRLPSNLGSTEVCSKAIAFCESALLNTTGQRNTTSGNWRAFVKGLQPLSKFPSFAETYFEHLVTCTKRCGSWNVFAVVVKGEQMTESEIQSAFKALQASFDNGLPKLRTVSKLDKNELVYSGCRLLTKQISRLNDAADRQRLMWQLINVASGLNSGRTGTRPDTYGEDALSGLLTTDNFANFQCLQGYSESIKRHAERRLRYFLWLCTVVWKDGHEYQPRKAYYQYGTRDLPRGHQRCHSAIVPLVDRRSNANGIWDLGNGGLFSEHHFLRRMNRTVNLPSACNEVDSWIESTHGLRKALKPLINEVSKGNVAPWEAGATFLEQLQAALQKFLDDHPEIDDEVGNQKLLMQREYARLNLHFCQQLLDSWLDYRYVNQEFLKHFLAGAYNEDKEYDDMFESLRAQLLADKI